MRRPIRNLLALSATAAVAALAAPALAAPTLAATAPAAAAVPSPTPKPDPSPTFDSQTYPWGPAVSANAEATARGRATFVQDPANPVNKLNRIEVTGGLQDLRPDLPGHQHYHSCAYVEFQYHGIYDPVGQWRNGRTYQACVSGGTADVGFEFTQYKANGLRLRVSQISIVDGSLLQQGEWHEVANIG
jgi:hypothetical protein